MAKQPEDNKTLDLALPRKRGRKAKYVTQAERQAAYRERRQQATASEQESLRDEIAFLKSALVRFQEAEVQLQVREQSIADAEKALSKQGDDKKLRDLEWQVKSLETKLDLAHFKRSDRLRDLLAKKFLMPGRDLSSVFLLDYLGKPIGQGYEFERATKEALEFGRKAAMASGNIREITGLLDRKRQIAEDEKAILDAANRILGDIHGRAVRIKEDAKTAAARVRREEDERAKAAGAAVRYAFPALEAEAVMLLLFLGDRYDYHLGEFRKMQPETARKWDIDYHLDQIASGVRHELQRRIEKAMQAGASATDAALALRAEFETAQPKIVEDNQALLNQIEVCRVASRIAEANRAKSG